MILQSLQTKSRYTPFKTLLWQYEFQEFKSAFTVLALGIEKNHVPPRREPVRAPGQMRVFPGWNQTSPDPFNHGFFPLLLNVKIIHKFQQRKLLHLLTNSLDTHARFPAKDPQPLPILLMIQISPKYLFSIALSDSYILFTTATGQLPFGIYYNCQYW